MLGSIEAGLRRDAQLVGPQLRYWAPEGAAGSLAQRCAGGAGLQALEDAFFADRPLEARLLQPWPLLRELQAAGVPCAALLSFSAEGGDNLGEANQVAAAAAAAAGLADQGHVQWEPPATWRHVYGASHAVY